MRAILLCAGQGTRLRPLTEDRPKCLVPYRGRPILDRAVETLRACGIRDLAVVTGYRADLLEGRGLTPRHNIDYASTNMVHSLFCAEDLMAGGFLVVYGDIVFHPRLVRALLEDPSDCATAVDSEWASLWRLRGLDPVRDAETLKVGPGGEIRELGRAPSGPADVQGQYIGLIRFSARGAEAARAFYHGLDPRGPYAGRDLRGMFMTAFLQEAIDRKALEVRPVWVKGGWAEVDSTEDLAAYERTPPELLEARP